MKKCSVCKEIKDLSSFHKRADAPDGYKYWCKVCVRNQRLSRPRPPSPLRQLNMGDAQLVRDIKAAYEAHYQRLIKLSQPK